MIEVGYEMPFRLAVNTMDLSKISEETAKQLSSFLETAIFFFSNPILRYKPIEEKKELQIVIAPNSSSSEKSEKFNPLLYHYALACIAIGSTIQATIPNATEPEPIGKAVVITIVLFLWIVSALLISIPAKYLSTNFHLKSFISSIIQAYSTIYLISSILTLLLWITFTRVGTPFGFNDTTSLWYFPIHFILTIIYVPWAVLIATNIKRVSAILITICIWLLILVFEGLSFLFWMFFHFAAYG